MPPDRPRLVRDDNEPIEERRAQEPDDVPTWLVAVVAVGMVVFWCWLIYKRGHLP